MIRTLFSLSASAVVALSVMAWLALAQEESNPVGPLSSSADENPFAELEPAAPSDAEQRALIDDLVQHAAGSATSDRLCKCVGESESAAKIQQALQRKLASDGLVFEDTPLEDVARYISETYQIPIQLSMPALEEIGVSADEPVTANLHGICLQSALRLLLPSLQLTYTIQNEVLLITTPEEAEMHLTTCVYDVRDLLPGTGNAADFDSLIDTIISCIETDTWAENGGGESEIRPLPAGFLVISQTPLVHEEICGLLTSIRELKRRPVAAAANAGFNGSLDEAVTDWNVKQQ